MPFDLQQPLKLDRTFDLASTLEVAEHIPPELADQFVDMMVRLAPIVLFSAAVPDQGGVSHVNEQWQDYWAKRFAEKQYVAIDCIRPRVWRNQAVSATYRQNILLYVRHDYLVTNEALQRESALARPEQLSIIHPEFYSRKIKQMDEDISFKRALKMLPHAFAHGVLRRFSSRN